MNTMTNTRTKVNSLMNEYGFNDDNIRTMIDDFDEKAYNDSIRIIKKFGIKDEEEWLENYSNYDKFVDMTTIEKLMLLIITAVAYETMTHMPAFHMLLSGLKGCKENYEKLQ